MQPMLNVQVCWLALTEAEGSQVELMAVRALPHALVGSAAQRMR